MYLVCVILFYFIVFHVGVVRILIRSFSPSGYYLYNYNVYMVQLVDCYVRLSLYCLAGVCRRFVYRRRNLDPFETVSRLGGDYVSPRSSDRYRSESLPDDGTTSDH